MDSILQKYYKYIKFIEKFEKKIKILYNLEFDSFERVKSR